MNTVTDGIKNIIFDFGGVIINIDFERTYNAFREKGITDFKSRFSESELIPLFYKLETGVVSPAQFRKKINEMTGLPLSDAEFDAAWNALLLDIPKERIDLLKKLSDKYRLFLLSNSNKIHYDFYRMDLIKKYGLDFIDLFERPYFSFEMGMAKPDTEIYKRVLTELGLQPDETLFIDDTFENIKGAQKTGMKTLFLEGEILDVFK